MNIQISLQPQLQSFALHLFSFLSGMVGQRRSSRNTRQSSVDMAPNDNSAAQARPSRRTARANAGTDGRADQLEVISQTLERPSRTTRPMTTVPQDAPVNPMAPTPVVRKKKAGGKRNVKDPARLFDEPKPLVPQPSGPATGVPVRIPAQGSPDSRFGFKLQPPPSPTYVGSQGLHAYQNRHGNSLSELSEEPEEQDNKYQLEDKQLDPDLYNSPPDDNLYADPMDGSYDVFHDPDPDLVQINKTIGHTNNEHQLDLSNADGRFIPEDDDDKRQSKPLADERQPPKSGDHAVHVERQVHSAAHIEHQGHSAPHIERQDYSTLHIERQDNSIPPVEPRAESAPYIEHQDNSAAHREIDQQGRPSSHFMV
ncbi:hypothetical protein EV363DRAFT_1302553 [Boletus edulis]|nr:hypothetical protein EV363DRAFT_1302553 [Boletus edulis]